MCSPAGRKISDPQSLMFSPLHVLLAVFNSGDQPARLRRGDLRLSVPRRASASSCSSATAAGMPAARWWRRSPSRSAARRARRLQHIGQVVSLAYLPTDVWLLARALERLVLARRHRGRRYRRIAGDRARPGRAALALCACRICPDALAHGRSVLDAHARQPQAADAAAGAAAFLVAAVPVAMSALLAARSNRPEISFAVGGRRLDPSGSPAAVRLRRSVTAR